jgi:four helix bundle protein
MGVRHFTDLACWQLADKLKKGVYEITAKRPVSQDRDFCNDIRRSSRSAPANISEGFGRFGHREFAHYLSIAHASLRETENHLLHLKRGKQNRARTLEEPVHTRPARTEGDVKASNVF